MNVRNKEVVMMNEQIFECVTVVPGTSTYHDYLALRHEVFCEELRRVPSTGQFLSDVPLESDTFDTHSVHVLCRNLKDGRALGCTRLILPGNHGLSIGKRYSLIRRVDASVGSVGEIGRLAIASDLRRHRGELSSAGLHQALNPKLWSDSKAEKRLGPIVALALYRELLSQAGRHGVTHCYAAMEPSLARLLTRIGLPFQEAGPLNTAVYPPRQPYLIGANAVRVSLESRDSCLRRFILGDMDSLGQGADALAL